MYFDEVFSKYVNPNITRNQLLEFCQKNKLIQSKKSANIKHLQAIITDHLYNEAIKGVDNPSITQVLHNFNIKPYTHKERRIAQSGTHFLPKRRLGGATWITEDLDMMSLLWFIAIMPYRISGTPCSPDVKLQTAESRANFCSELIIGNHANKRTLWTVFCRKVCLIKCVQWWNKTFFCLFFSFLAPSDWRVKGPRVFFFISCSYVRGVSNTLVLSKSGTVMGDCPPWYKNDSFSIISCS